MTQLEKLKTTLGILSSDVSKDDILNLLLEDVLSDILSWINRNTLPTALESTQRSIAVIRYNMLGIEGQTSHSEGSISRSLEELPESIRLTIGQYRLVKVVRYAAETT